MMTNYAKEHLVDELGADSDITSWKYIGFGTGGATAAALTQTALTTEASGGSYARLTATQGEGDNADQYKLSGTWTNNSGGSVAVSELGVFDAATAGNMICRLTTNDGDIAGVQTIADGDTLTINSLTITINDSSE